MTKGGVLVQMWKKEGKIDDKKRGQTDQYSGRGDVDRNGPYPFIVQGPSTAPTNFIPSPDNIRKTIFNAILDLIFEFYIVDYLG
jgi:hypothetical protein